MGKGGGGNNAAAEQAAREEERKQRIASNIRAVKLRFFKPEDARSVPDPVFGPQLFNQSRDEAIQLAGGSDFVNLDPDGVSFSSPQGRQSLSSFLTNPTRGFGAALNNPATNQSAIDAANAFNKNRTISDDPTDARQSSFDDLQERVRNRFLPEFQDTVTDARRELKFALARRGIFGGSAQVDAESRFSDRISEGEREISDRVLAGRNEKERLDQSLINNLIGQAQTDIDQSTLLSGLGSNLQSNNNRALTGATNANLNTLFTDVGTLFKDINDSRALQAGFNGTNLGSLFGQNKGISGIFSNASGAAGRSGTTT